LDAAVGLIQANGVEAAEFVPPFPAAELGCWHVLHTKSRQEKVVAQDLAAMNIGHYLPLVREVRFYGRRKAVVEAPLFPGYVFMRGELDDAYRADRTKRIAQIIPVRDQGELTVELGNLYLALTKNATLTPWPYLKKGIRVEVRSGPFRGLQGVIEDRLASHRLVLKVDMLGQAVCMEIDGSLLDVLE
jgi:transcription termination/antitermination protein NusG